MHLHRLIPFAVLLLSTLLCGCSLVVDAGRYIGDGGAPDQDIARSETGPYIDLPSAPEIALTPTAPQTADALVVSITRASVDPLGSAVSYEYRWNRNDLPTDIDAETVPADRTRSNERWRVSVTPVTDTQRGPSVSAEITIGNTPPTMRSVGLNNYRVFATEVLEAISGPISDADSDPTGAIYAWYVNGEVIPGVTLNRLDLTTLSTPVMPGDRIHVTATPSDSSSQGGPVTSGNAEVLQPGTQWRQLMPNRMSESSPPPVVYDRIHDRHLAFVLNGRFYDADTSPPRFQLWEIYSHDGETVYNQLYPQGSPTAYISTPIYDEANARVLFFGGAIRSAGGFESSNELFALDITQRGGERWNTVSTLGEEPPSRYLASTYLDTNAQELYISGGVTITTSGTFGLLRDTWRLDLEDSTWTQIGTDTGAYLGSALVRHPNQNRLIAIGGSETAFGATPMLSDEIRILDLSATDAQFEATSTQLPQRVAFSFAVVDAPRNRILIGGGGNLVPYTTTGALPIQALDLTTNALSAITTSGTGPTLGGVFAMASPSSDTHFSIHPGYEVDGARTGLSIYTFNVADDSWTPVHVYALDAPPALMRAFVGTRDAHSMLLFGGLRSESPDVIGAHTWRYANEQWSLANVGSDPSSAESPSPRAGGVTVDLNTYGHRLIVWGGMDADGNYVDEAPFALNTSGSELTWERLSRGRPDPSDLIIAPRSSHLIFGGVCSNEAMGVFGGRNATGPLSDRAVQRYSCAIPTTSSDCRWDVPSVSLSGAAPEPDLGFAAATRVGSEWLIFGGRSNLDTRNGTNALWATSQCGGSVAQWTLAAQTGNQPSPRLGHSMVGVRNPITRNYIGALLFGGGSDDDKYNDLYYLTTSSSAPDTYTWTELDSLPTELPPARSNHAMVYDRRNERVLLYGGESADGDLLSDLWELHWVPGP